MEDSVLRVLEEPPEYRNTAQHWEFDFGAQRSVRCCERADDSVRTGLREFDTLFRPGNGDPGLGLERGVDKKEGIPLAI